MYDSLKGSEMCFSSCGRFLINTETIIYIYIKIISIFCAKCRIVLVVHLVQDHLNKTIIVTKKRLEKIRKPLICPTMGKIE